MVKDLYSKIPPKARLFVAILLVLLLFYLIVSFASVKAKKIPEDFLVARQQASLIAQDIVNISKESSERLTEISALDKNANYADAVVLVVNEMKRTAEMREKALKLSLQLETMAKNISAIEPDESARLAVEAVSIDTTIINRLFAYNDYFSQLLGILQNKFLGKEANSSEKINELVVKINEEARTINELNEKFNALLARFDAVK